MDEQSANTDALVAGIAALQHGVVGAGQLHAAGVSKDSIWKAARARLHRVYRGVYAVGHSGLSNEGRWMAAVLACGEGAVLSHRSAAELWRMLAPGSCPIHVTVRGAAGRKHRDLIAHRSPSLPTHETAVHRRIPLTTPERTLRDLPRAVPASLVRRTNPPGGVPRAPAR